MLSLLVIFSLFSPLALSEEVSLTQQEWVCQANSECLDFLLDVPPINVPDKELKQVVIKGSYYPKNPERVKEVEIRLREAGFLKDGETLKEKYPWRLKRGDEKYTFTNNYYCYNAVKIEDREPCYYRDIRIRTYNKEGQVTTEDCLRVNEEPNKYDEQGRYTEEYLKQRYKEYPHETKPEDGILAKRFVIAYIPYNENNHKTRIVRLKGEKEVVLEEFGGFSLKKSQLIELYYSDHISTFRGFGHDYDENRQCHTFQRPR